MISLRQKLFAFLLYQKGFRGVNGLLPVIFLSGISCSITSLHIENCAKAVPRTTLLEASNILSSRPAYPVLVPGTSPPPNVRGELCITSKQEYCYPLLWIYLYTYYIYILYMSTNLNSQLCIVLFFFLFEHCKS